MTKQQLVEYLRNQSYWIEQLAKELEDGKELTCLWCVDLEIPIADSDGVVS